jgi:putative spermidine/putrescine transport system permease protein
MATEDDAGWSARTRGAGVRIRRELRALVAPRTERERTRRRIVALCAPFLALAAFAGLYPLWEMFRMSLSTSKLETTAELWPTLVETVRQGRVVAVGASADAYRTLLSGGPDGVYHRAALNTLWFSVATTAASLAVAVPVAHALENYDLPGERHLVTVLSFPISLPGIVAAFMIIVLLGNTGLLTNLTAALTGRDPTALALSTTGVGLFLAYLYSMIPRSLLLLRGAYAEVNTAAEEAARSLGASPLRTFRYVTLPAIKPGLVGAAILTFRTAMAIFGTLLILSQALVPQPWTYQIDRMLNYDFAVQLAMAMGVTWFVFVFAATVLGLRYTSAEVGL